MAAVGPTEARAILAAVAGDRLEPLYALTLALGLRQGEALGLTWDDVDLDAATLTVRRTLQRSAHQYRFEETKTHGSRRAITIPAPVVAALRQQPHDSWRSGCARAAAGRASRGT